MFKSYMFIPANKKRFIEKSSQLKDLNHRIFDLEDSVVEKDIKIALSNLQKIEILQNDWVRIRIGGSEQNDLINELNKLGFNNYMIPKFCGYEEFYRIFSDIKTINIDARFILLLENPRSYIELEKILIDFSSSIHGISLGIHDFTFITGMKNDYKTLRNIRVNIMIIAKAYSVIPIDVVSMYLKDKKLIEEEIIDGFNLGYRGKLLIHPNQLEVLNGVEFYSLSQVNEYKQIYNHYQEKVQKEDTVFSYNDRVYEKMHIEEIKKILEWESHYYGTDW